MAGNENSGGYRPTAPQNNPANVSATGGAGQSGTQAPKYIPGMKQLGSTGVETMAQQASAPMAGTPPMPVFAKELGTLLDPTNNPNEPVTAGVDAGPGPGSDILPKNISADTRPDENRVIVQKYLPVLMQAANLPDTPDSYKRFINYLLEQQ